MSQIEVYAHVLPRMFYTECTTTIGAQQTEGRDEGRDEGPPKIQSFG
jgi:hypothetical protein